MPHPLLLAAPEHRPSQLESFLHPVIHFLKGELEHLSRRVVSRFSVQGFGFRVQGLEFGV